MRTTVGGAAGLIVSERDRDIPRFEPWKATSGGGLFDLSVLGRTEELTEHGIRCGFSTRLATHQFDPGLNAIALVRRAGETQNPLALTIGGQPFCAVFFSTDPCLGLSCYCECDPKRKECQSYSRATHPYTSIYFILGFRRILASTIETAHTWQINFPDPLYRSRSTCGNSMLFCTFAYFEGNVSRSSWVLSPRLYTRTNSSDKRPLLATSTHP